MFKYSWKRDRDDKKLYEVVEKICILISLLIIFMAIFIIFISNNNCYLEKYEEYPCQGATHYARVHRNRNEPCERYKRICEEK